MKIFFIILLLLMFSASTAQALTAPQPLSATRDLPAANGLLRVAMPAAATSLDPFHKATEENLQVAHLIFDPLMRWDSNFNPEYRLAESLERIEPDIWRIHLRKGMVFHSGNPMTARDVVWTFSRAKKSQDFKALFGDIKDLVMIDAYTVDIHTVDGNEIIPGVLTYFFIFEAKTLLKKAGYGDKPVRLTMIAPNDRYTADEKIAMSVAGMLQKVGILVELKTMPRAQYWPEFKKREADLAMVGWQPDTLDTTDYFESLLMCENLATGSGVYNFGGYCNPELDQLMLEAKQESDPARRHALLAKVVRIAYDDVAFIPLHYEPHSWAANKRLINAGRIVSGDNFAQFADAVMLDLEH